MDTCPACGGHMVCGYGCPANQNRIDKRNRPNPQPCMEQRITLGYYSGAPLPVWDVDYNGVIETFSNYDDAYRRFCWLSDHTS